MEIHFDDVTFDEARRQLSRSGQPLHVTPKVFQLLGILIAERPRAVSKDELQQRLWPDTFVADGNLPSLITELRSALGDDARKPRYIRTHHGYGYSFLPETVEAPSGVVAAAQGVVEESPSRPRRWGPVAVALFLLCVSGLAVWLFFRSRAQAGPPMPGQRIRSIAVLPFDTRGSTKLDAHLGLGLADLVITRLSNVDELTVRPTSAVRAFADGDLQSRDVARRLKVDAILEGSIRIAGDRVRVTVQFFDVHRDKPIWAEQFDERRAEMFTIEDRLAARVAEAVLVRLTSDERALLAKRYTVNPEAYQLYIQGRYHLQKGAGAPLDAPRIAAAFFNKAIEKDPRYALAWADLARAHLWMARGRAAAADNYPKAEQAILRAKELDPHLYEVLVPLAILRMYWNLDYGAAERDLQRALALRPRDSDALAAYGYLLQCLGRVAEAHAVRTRLVEADPLNPTSHWGMANGHLAARRYDLARTKVEAVLAMDPGHYEANVGLIRILLAEGRSVDATEHARKLVAADNRPRSRAFLAYTLAQTGQSAEAREILAQLEKAAGKEFVAPFHLVLIHVALEEFDAAFALLEKAVEEREYAVRLKTEPLLDPLRNDPRFQVLLRRAGFATP